MINLQNFSSITQEEPAGKTSEKYSFIPTTRIISDLDRAGWFPVEAQEASAKGDNKGFQKHLIRFRNDNVVSQGSKFQPEIVMTNAHNGKASFKLMGGVINFVCLNGMIVADSIVAENTIRHQGYTEEVVNEAVYNIIEDMPRVYNSIERFQDITLDDDEQFAFAKGALMVTFDDEQLENVVLDDSARRLMRPMRSEERDGNLWNSLNVVQEKLIRGGRFLKTQADPYSRPKVTKRRAVKSIDKNVDINRGLWAYAEALADLKTSK
jgi:hypothetical protein